MLLCLCVQTVNDLCEDDLSFGFSLNEMQVVVAQFQPISSPSEFNPSARLRDNSSGAQFEAILPDNFKADLLQLWAGELGSSEFHELLLRWPLQLNEETQRYYPQGPMLYIGNDMEGINLNAQAFASGMANLVRRLYITDSNALSARAIAGNVNITCNLKARIITSKGQGGGMVNVSTDIPLLFTEIPNQINAYTSCATYNGNVAGFPTWLENQIGSGFDTLPVATNKNPFGETYKNIPAFLYGVRFQMLVNPAAAGCQTGKVMNLVKVKAFTERYDIWDVPSKNNNCIFAVIRHAMGNDFAKGMHAKTFYKKMRNSLELFADQKVPLSYCAHIAEMLKIRIELYDCNSVYPFMTFNPTYNQDFTAENVRTIRIYIENEHAFWIREKDTRICEICNESFDARGYQAHEKRCKVRKDLLQWKCCHCGTMVNIPKTDAIQSPADLSLEVIHQFHHCNQRKLSFYQRMIVSKAQKARGEPTERYVRPHYIPQDNEMIDLNDQEKVESIGRHILDEYEPVVGESTDDASSVDTSSTRKRKRNGFAVWRYLCEEKLYCIDIETFADATRSSAFTAYSVGTWFSERPESDQYVEFEGPTCLEQMFDDMLYWKRKTGIRTILTFNGRGFDYNFILRAIVDGSKRHGIRNHRIKQLTPNGSNIMGFQWGRARSFDLFSFLMTSLAKACAEFKVDPSLQKASFPHAFIKDFDTMNYCGSIPDAKYWADPKKMPTYENRVQYFGSQEIADDIWPLPDAFYLRKFSNFYLRKDVLGMLEVYRIFAREVYSRLRKNICYYLTAPALAYGMFRTNLFDFYIPLPRDEQMQAFFQSAVYGGRVYPRRLGFQSSAYNVYDEILREVEIDPSAKQEWKNENLFDEVDKRIEQRYDDAFVEVMKQDYICDMDVVSLYPTAMMSFYPCGKMFVSTAAELEVLETMARDDPASLIRAWDLDPYETILKDDEPNTTFYHLDIGHGIFKVDITPNQNLLEAVLPRREKNLTKWDLSPIVEGTYTSIDLCRALQKGYTITKFYQGVSFQGIAPLLRNHILSAKAYKEEGDKDPVNKAAIRTFGKLILNSTYGKFLQKPRFSVVEIIRETEIVDALRKYGWDEILKIVDDGPNSIYIVSSTKMDEEERMEEIGKPTYLGAFVLSHSRRIMDRIYHTADPCGNCLKNLPYYGDTDSLLLPAHTLPRLASAGLIATPGNKKFGQVSNENGDARIIRGYFLAPKLYAFEYVTNKDGHYRSYHIRAKGVPSDCMNFEQYILMDQQRWNYLTGQIQKTDENLCRIFYESFLRTGIKQRIRSFKEGELVALREQEQKEKELQEKTLLEQLQFLEHCNRFEENLQCDGDLNSSLIVPPAPVFAPERPLRTRVSPFSVLLTYTSRSISRSVYSERIYNLDLNLLLPQHFNTSEPVCFSCDTSPSPWLDGYLVNKQTIS